MNLALKKTNLFQKTVLMSLALVVLLFGFSQYIGIDFSDTAEASLKSQIQSNDQKKLEKTVDTAGQNFVKTAREIAIVALVVLLAFMAYSLFIKKSVEGVADVKGRLLGLLIAIAFIFFPEQLIGAIFGIFGVKL